MARRLILAGLWLAALVAMLLALVMSLLQLLVGSRRAVRVFVGADQTLNAAIGGSEDETISSRAGKGAQRGVWRYCLLCKLLDVVDPGHCRDSIEQDEGKPAS
ncbi:hypothetical protein [Vogesella sp. AC12]|uniref:hypothetical protein n=1 Tax=Vogesella sp. AC12 TaxID=2950550 RepID=UPI00210D26C4|nr:hypothetical protein [Vogesella sp. AC12]MCQ4142853.1 hypothetical protein [Vogesella sp. AC12]